MKASQMMIVATILVALVIAVDCSCGEKTADCKTDGDCCDDLKCAGYTSMCYDPTSDATYEMKSFIEKVVGEW